MLSIDFVDSVENTSHIVLFIYYHHLVYKFLNLMKDE